MAKPLNLLAQIMEQETQNYEFGALHFLNNNILIETENIEFK
jgi:hypothetical protein